MQSLANINNNAEMRIVIDTLRVYEPNTHSLSEASNQALEYIKQLKDFLTVNDSSMESSLESLLKLESFKQKRESTKVDITMHAQRLEYALNKLQEEEMLFKRSIDRLECLLKESPLLSPEYSSTVTQIISVNSLKLITLNEQIKKAESDLQLLRSFINVSIPVVDSYSAIRSALDPELKTLNGIKNKLFEHYDNAKNNYSKFCNFTYIIGILTALSIFLLFYDLRYKYVSLIYSKNFTSGSHMPSLTEALQKTTESMTVFAVTLITIAGLFIVIAINVAIIGGIYESIHKLKNPILNILTVTISIFILSHVILSVINTAKRVISYLSESHSTKDIIFTLPNPSSIWLSLIFILIAIPVIYKTTQLHCRVKKLGTIINNYQ